MSDESSDDSPQNAETRTQKTVAASVNSEITRKHEGICAFWFAVAGLIGGALLNYHYTSSGLVLTVSAVITAFYGLFILIVNNVGRKNIDSSFMMIILAVNCMLIGFSPFSFYEDFNPQVQRFFVTRKTAFVPILKNGLIDKYSSLPFMLVRQTPSKVATRIQFMINMIVENEQPITATVVAYSLSSAESLKGPWQELCSLSTRGQQVAWVDDPKKAIIIGTDDYLEFKLLEKGIAPGSTISGWSAWACPDKCSLNVLKLSLTDASGHTSSQIIPDISEDKRAEGLGSTMSVTPEKISVEGFQLDTRPCF